MPRPARITDLPPETLASIAKLLPFIKKAQLAMMCRTMRDASRQHGGVWYGLPSSACWFSLKGRSLPNLLKWMDRLVGVVDSVDSVGRMRVNTARAHCTFAAEFYERAPSFWPQLEELSVAMPDNKLRLCNLHAFDNVRSLHLDLSSRTDTLLLCPSLLPPRLTALEIDGKPAHGQLYPECTLKLPPGVTSLGLRQLELDGSSILTFANLKALSLECVGLDETRVPEEAVPAWRALRLEELELVVEGTAGTYGQEIVHVLGIPAPSTKLRMIRSGGAAPLRIHPDLVGMFGTLKEVHLVLERRGFALCHCLSFRGGVFHFDDVPYPNLSFTYDYF